MFTVTMTACVAGNPLKAWRGTTGEDDTEHVPDDVWEDQSHEFGDLEAAKDFIRVQHPQVTTHIELSADGEVIYRKDRGDDLDLAAPDYVQEHDRPPEADDDAVPEAPPLVPSQECR